MTKFVKVLTTLSLSVLMFQSVCFGFRIYVPTDYIDIQPAINNAGVNDTIVVENGIYDENLVIAGKHVILISLYALTDDPVDIVNTIIDGNGVARVIDIDRARGKIQGFTIMNGFPDFGSGIRIWNSPEDSDVDSMIIRDNFIKQNPAGGIFAWQSRAEIYDNWFSNNHSSAAGGGIMCYDFDSSIVSGNVFIDNTAQTTGAAIACQATSYNYIVNNTMVNNTADLAGGGINVATSSVAFIENNIVVQNSGGGIDRGSATVYLSCNDVWGNYNGDNYTNCTAGPGDFSEDPEFCNITSNNIWLYNTSPCAADNNGCGVLIGAKDVNCMIINPGYIPDLAMGYETGNGVSVFLGDGAGGFGSEQNNYSVLCQDLTTGDFDGDGNLDIAATDLFWLLKVYFGDGMGGMSAPDEYPLDLGWAIASGDFDGINGLDLAVANVTTNNIDIYENDGSGGFSHVGSYPIGNQGRDIHTGDFDGSNGLDLAVVNKDDNDVSILLNDGTGDFSNRNDYPVGISPNQIEMEDFNDDTILDMAVTNGDDNDITIYFGDGAGGFINRQDYPTGTEPRGIEWGYFNFDYIPDLVVTNHTDNDISILVNDGTGDFSDRTDYACGPGNSPNDVAVGHLNIDGKPDLVVCHHSDNTMDIMINNGSNEFPTTSPIICNNFPYVILLDDFNHDRYLPIEIYVTNNNDAGAGSFREAIELANSIVGPNEIIFDPLGAPIELVTRLPHITDDYTFISGAGNTILGSAIPGNAGLVLRSSYNEISEFNIVDFNDDGLVIDNGGNNVIQNCQIYDNEHSGFYITGFGSNNVITGNTIYGNIQDGIEIYSGTGNTISQNIIYDNGDLGIDLGNNGVTLNDVNDLDTGPNDYLNYPEISLVKSTFFLNDYTIWGRAAPNATVEFFLAHPYRDKVRLADPSGHGEAFEYIGSIVCDGSGDFEYALPETYNVDYSELTATATDDQGNTSEFCPNFPLIPNLLIIKAWAFKPPGPEKQGTFTDQIVNLDVTDPVGDYIRMDENNVLTQTIVDASYVEDGTADIVTIDWPLEGDYDIKLIGTSADPSGYMIDFGISIDGTPELILEYDIDPPAFGYYSDPVIYGVTEDFHYINGDADGNYIVDILDIVMLIDWKFKECPPGAGEGTCPAPEPLEAGDANCNGVVDIIDIVHLIDFKFKDQLGPCRRE
jgi:parallel beta-helix repeat protein